MILVLPSLLRSPVAGNLARTRWPTEEPALARLDERFAKEAFNRFLSEVEPDAPRAWEDGPNFPDFLLRLGTEQYAVEVTRVVAEVHLGGRTYSKLDVGGALERFAVQLQEEAERRGILSGTYVVWLEPIPDFREVAAQARDAFLRYVARTQELPSAPEEVVLRRTGVHWSIRKHHPGEDCLLWTIGDGTGGWEGEIAAEFPELLRRAIAPKVPKARTYHLSTILLLLDDYHHASPGLWRASLPAEFAPEFHTIARTFGEYQCQVLSSQRPSWPV